MCDLFVTTRQKVNTIALGNCVILVIKVIFSLYESFIQCRFKAVKSDKQIFTKYLKSAICFSRSKVTLILCIFYHNFYRNKDHYFSLVCDFTVICGSVSKLQCCVVSIINNEVYDYEYLITYRDHSFSTFPKFSEKLLFLSP